MSLMMRMMKSDSQMMKFKVVLCRPMAMNLSEEKSFDDFKDKLIALFVHVYALPMTCQEEAIEVIEANCEYWRNKTLQNSSDEMSPTEESGEILKKEWVVENKVDMAVDSDVESNNDSQTPSETEEQCRMKFRTENELETNELENSCSTERLIRLSECKGDVCHLDVAMATNENKQLECEEDMSDGRHRSSDQLISSSPRRNTGESSSDAESNTRINVIYQGKKLSCDLCKKTFIRPRQLSRHQLIHKERACHICGRNFPRKQTLDLHMKIHQGQKDIVCDRCDYRCYLQIDLQRHMRKSHTREKPFVCDVCSKPFREKKTLKKHKKAVHDKSVKFYCDQCDYKTHLEIYLSNHKANVHDTQREMFTCEVCGKTIKYRQDYMCHIRTHQGERTYKCPLCPAAFYCATSRSKHKRNVHAERLHICKVCAKKFSQRSHLQRHLVVHSGTKDFSCPACSYCCNLESNLRKHCKEQHGMIYPPLRQIRVTQVEDNLHELLSK